MVAVALVEFKTVVGRGDPFHSTTDVFLKRLLPVSDRVKPALPAVELTGDSELKTGVFQPELVEALVWPEVGKAPAIVRRRRKKEIKNRVFTGISQSASNSY